MTSKDQHQYKDRYMLRLPDGMRERIKRAAADNGRTMNAEIVGTLQEAYPDYDNLSDRLAQMVMIASDILIQMDITEKDERYFKILGEVMANIHKQMEIPDPKHRSRDD